MSKSKQFPAPVRTEKRKRPEFPAGGFSCMSCRRWTVGVRFVVFWGYQRDKVMELCEDCYVSGNYF